jgi:hydrogenase maturation protease
MSGADRAVVVGVGNPYRGDDGVGLAVAARLAARVPAGVTVVECVREPTRLLETWAGASAAVVVDAVEAGATPGALQRFDASDRRLPERAFRSSTHAFGVGEAIELARALGRLPACVVVYGVEGIEFAAGASLSAPVEAAVEPAARAVLAELEQLREEEPCTNRR